MSVAVNCIVLLLMSIIPSLSWFLVLFILFPLPHMFIAYACADIFSVLLESCLVSLF
jgi:hypothetical protein